MLDRKQVNKKAISIINSKPPHEAIIQLLQFQNELKQDEQKLWVREPIVYIFQNQHDWQNLMKCLRNWKGLQKFQRGFHERMKKRVEQQYEKNISQNDIKKQLPRLIQKHNSLQPKEKPLVKGIQKYFESIKTQNQTKIYKKAQSQKSDSNSISSRGSQASLRPALRKPTLGMLTKKQNILSVSDKALTRNPKRLTFGIGNNVRNLNKELVLNEGNNPENKNQNRLQAQIVHSQQEKIQNKEMRQIKNTKNNLQKASLFQKKQQVVQRINPIFKTQQKESQQFPEKNIQKSYSKSITPHKPLIQRKKVIITKANPNRNTFKENDFSQNEAFQDFQQYDDFQFSEKIKQKRNEFSNSQEQELKNQIQKQNNQSKENTITNKQIQNKENKNHKEAQVQRQQILLVQKNEKQKELQKRLQKRQPREIKNVNALQKKQQFSNRRQNQLFSDYQLQLMNLNLNQESNIDVYKITNKLKLNSFKNLSQILKRETEQLKQNKRR